MNAFTDFGSSLFSLLLQPLGVCVYMTKVIL